MKIIAAALVCLAPSFAWCTELAPTAAASAGVASAVERYANAIACAGVQVRPSDVLMLSSGYQGAFQARYAVLWVGDMSCFGGAGTEQAQQTQLAIATFSNGRYVVQPQLSTPSVAFDSPVRFVSKVVSAGADTLVLEGKEYAPNDPQSTPSVPVRFTLRADAQGNWRLVDKVKTGK